MRLHLSIPAAVMGLCLSLLATEKAKAATFTFDPTITFEVGDGFFTEPFDGRGDADAVFPGNFDTVVLGTLGEAAEFAEFDISGFSIPAQEVITSATFQTRISSLQVGGLGVNFGENPDSLGVRGYVGNGIAEASDFQAGTLLDTVDISSASVGQLLSFDVTAFVQNLVSNDDSFVGFGVRAQDFGGLALERFPTLTIATSAVSTTVPEPTSVLGLLAFGALGTGSMLKRQQKK
jgi:hypothetical protein